MSDAQFGSIFSMAIAISAVMAIVNLLRYRSRGPAAFALAAAFVSLGFTIYLLKNHAPQNVVVGGIIVTALLLGADFVLRAKTLSGGKKR